LLTSGRQLSVRSPTHPTPTMAPIAFITSLWILTASAILLVLTLYRIQDKPAGLSFLAYRDGKLLIVAVIAFLCSGAMGIWYAMRLRKIGERPLRLALRWNVGPLMLTSIALETTLRLLATETPMETRLLGKTLLPYRLETIVERYRVDSFLSYDPTLGWIVKPNLNSLDGLYDTSPDGIRTSKTGSRFTRERNNCRIVLVGDSHTFGEELRLEDTWGYSLQWHLPECEILNFGVGGYSVGQMYLRYLRDVRPWHPTIVLFALSSNTAGRTMGVYGLTRLFPGIPWAQPRFLLRDGDPTPINIPLPSLQEIEGRQWISDLPAIDYDWSFAPGRWELQRWRYFYHSYLFRLYTTRFSIWRRQQKGDSFEELNHALLRAFLRTAESDHSLPLILYLPDRHDYKNTDGETPSLQILRSSGVNYIDLRPCLSDLPTDDRFLPQGEHYSRRGSQVIATCVGTHVASLHRHVQQQDHRHVPNPAPFLGPAFHRGS